MDPLAAYAAVVATAALAWQVYLQVRRTRGVVRVEVRHATEEEPTYVSDGGGGGIAGQPRMRYAVSAVAVNHGDTAEYVECLGFQNAAKTRGVHDDEGRREVPPKGRVEWTTWTNLLGFDPTDGFYAYAELSSGRWKWSKLELPDAYLLESADP